MPKALFFHSDTAPLIDKIHLDHSFDPQHTRLAEKVEGKVLFQHKDKNAPVACKESFVLVAVLLSAKARDRSCVSDI